MPTMTVDDLGVYIGGRRAKPAEKGGMAKLKAIIEPLPINGESVTLIALKKASTHDVVMTVTALGDAGAPSVLIKTKARHLLPIELLVVPASKVSDPQACSIVVMVTDKYATGVWALKGGGGTRTRKGFAGPDLSNTQRAIEKRLKTCSSHVAFFSSAHQIPWQHAFSVGALLKMADNKGRLDQIALLERAPVAGRKVKLGR